MDCRTFDTRVRNGPALVSAFGVLLFSPSAARGGEVAKDHVIPPEEKLAPRRLAALFERGERRVYRGEELHTIGMPCGGIATGQLYVRGDGTLGQWWIFNNSTNTGYGHRCYRTYRPPSPIDQGFAICVKPAGGEAVVRKLDGSDFDAIEFTGEYPIARVRYRTQERPRLPVEVGLEIFSPFIPLNARDSGLPVTVLRFEVENTSGGPVEATLAGWLQNGVCLNLAGQVPARSRNAVLGGGGLTSVRLDIVEDVQLKRREERRVTVFEDFESGTYDKWTVQGSAFGPAPATGKFGNQQSVEGWHGKHFINTYRPDDGPQGTLTSKPFKIVEPYLAFLVGGGDHPGRTCMNLIVNGKVVRTVAGRNNEKLAPAYWDVAEFAGKEAHLEIVDRHSAGWGHINIDYIHFTNLPPELKLAAGFPADDPSFGDMAITAMDLGAAACAAWVSKGEFLADLEDEKLGGGPPEQVYPLGRNRSGVLASRFRLGPGEKKNLTFLVTWCFPNRSRVGNMYGNWFKSSIDVARYVAENYRRLSAETRLFRDAYFDTTLPYWFVQRVAMPVSTLATETCQWWRNGRFYAWEGVGCCAGTCTHVWNYEHACARLFPELSRSTRLMQDLDAGFDPKTGLVGFRSNRAYAADGQCGTVLKLYREHLMSADRDFLDTVWPKARKIIGYLISRDRNADGVIEDSQHNTFDINFVGPNTFVGSLYLAALRAAEEMARLEGERDLADEYHEIYERGRAFTAEKLWNGEYFIQRIPEGHSGAHQYGTGCLADQLFGQGWAHQLGLGYIYPRELVKTGLRSVFRYSWSPDIGPYNNIHRPERWFARPGEAGLFICTWPKGGRPAGPVRYRNEVWTGIEYQVAGHMLYEGMVGEALAIVRAVHDRYDGARHNPWNEVECGDHYARALASWGCLLGAEGFVYDGPAGKIGFAPRLSPENFKAFFTSARGWGSLVQKRVPRRQTNRIEVRWGSLRARELLFEIPEGRELAEVSVALTSIREAHEAGRRVPARAGQEGRFVRLSLREPADVNRGQALDAVLRWR